MLYMYMYKRKEDKHLEYMNFLAGYLTKREVYISFGRQTERIWKQ